MPPGPPQRIPGQTSPEPHSRRSNAFGWAMLTIAIINLALAALSLLEHDPRHQGAPFGFAMFAAFSGIPALITLFRLRRKQQHQDFMGQIRGFIQSRNAFTIAELARKIGRSELEAEGIIARLTDSDNLDLAFHRPTESYHHRNRILQTHQIVSSCGHCGAPTPAQVIFEGEELICSYCGKRL